MAITISDVKYTLFSGHVKGQACGTYFSHGSRYPVFAKFGNTLVGVAIDNDTTWTLKAFNVGSDGSTITLTSSVTVGGADPWARHIQKISETEFFLTYAASSTGYMRFGTVSADGVIALNSNVCSISIQGGFNAAVVDKVRRVVVCAYNYGYDGKAASYTYDAYRSFTIKTCLNSTAYSTWHNIVAPANNDGSFLTIHRDYSGVPYCYAGSVDSNGYLTLAPTSSGTIIGGNHTVPSSEDCQHMQCSLPHSSIQNRTFFMINRSSDQKSYKIMYMDTTNRTVLTSAVLESPRAAWCHVIPDEYQAGQGLILAGGHYADGYAALIPFTYSDTAISIDLANKVKVETPASSLYGALGNIAANVYTLSYLVPDNPNSPTYWTSSVVKTVTTTPTVTLPDKPTNLTVTVGQSTANLNWTLGARSTGHNIKLNSETPISIGGYTTYAMTGLSPNTEYTFGVESVNAAGISGYTSVAKKTLPAPPQNFRCESLKSLSFTLKWDPHLKGADSYNIYENDGTGMKLLTNTYQQYYYATGKKESTTYSYCVEAVNATGVSAQTGIISVTTPPNINALTNTTSLGGYKFKANSMVLESMFTPAQKENVIFSYLVNGVVPSESNVSSQGVTVSNLREGSPMTIKAIGSDGLTMEEVQLVPPLDTVGILDMESSGIISNASPDLTLNWSRFKVNPLAIKKMRLYFLTCDVSLGDSNFEKGYIDTTSFEPMSKLVTFTNLVSNLTKIGQRYAITITCWDDYAEGHITNRIYITRQAGE